VEDAVAELARDGAKVLAGGQSLVPVLAMRLGRPSTLVDINAIPELRWMGRTNGSLWIGAMVRQRQVQYEEVSKQVQLLRLALPWVDTGRFGVAARFAAASPMLIRRPSCPPWQPA
jgi:2-furoyl-CoA dehydrogenase FAD binding subunit